MSRKDVSLQVIKEVFSFFDKEDQNRLDIRLLERIIRCCGQNPTNQEIKEYSELIQTQKQRNYFEFQDVVEILGRISKNQREQKAELTEAFVNMEENQESQDQQTGTISIDELVHNLKSSGEQLSEEEVEQFLQLIKAYNDSSSQTLNYLQLVDILTKGYQINQV